MLDLYCTNGPGLVKSSNIIPSISDHNIIIVDSSIRGQQPKKPKCTIKQWSKVDWEAVKEESSKLRDDFLSHHNERTVESNYEAFCQHVNDIITGQVPTKQSNSRHKVPWLTTKLRRVCRNVVKGSLRISDCTTNLTASRHVVVHVHPTVNPHTTSTHDSTRLLH